jgi:hypothetical protein
MNKKISLKYIPENFNFEQLKKDFPPDGGFVPVDYKVYLFLSMIYEKYPYQESMRNEFGDYTFINAKQDLERAFSIKCLRSMRIWLSGAGVIVYTNYEIDSHPRGYRFIGKYACAPCKSVVISKCTMVRKINKQIIPDKNAISKYPVLYDSLQGLQIDSVGAFAASRQLLDDEAPLYPARRGFYLAKKVNTVSYYQSMLKRPANPWLRNVIDTIAICNVISGRYYFSLGGKSGRLFHNVLGMRKGIRKYITWNGLQLSSYDIANSQPFLAILLFFPRFWGIDKDSGLENLLADDQKNQKKSWNKGCLRKFRVDNKDIRDIRIERLDIKGINRGIDARLKNNKGKAGIYLSTIMFDKVGQVSVPQDVKDYVLMCKKGRLYDEMLIKAKALGGEFSNYTRDEMKVAILQVFFSSNSFIHQKEAALKQLFKHLFPNVYDMFSFIKSKVKSDLAVLLQSIEKTLILDNMVKRFATKFPGFPIITIHDSIATLATHSSFLKEIMLEVFNEKLGYVPKLDKEDWEPPLLLSAPAIAA